MDGFEEVKKYVSDTAREKLAPTEVVRVHMREGLTSFDEEPAYHIDVVFEGDQPGGKNTSGLHLALFKHLWEIKDNHFPVVRYVRVENEAKHHAPR